MQRQHTTFLLRNYGFPKGSLSMKQRMVDDVEACGEVLITMYVISTNTKDYGDKFVLRRHAACRRAADEVLVERTCKLFDDADAARAALPDGLYNTGRMAEDDPVIVETWL